jgi:hypothetical protein
MRHFKTRCTAFILALCCFFVVAGFAQDITRQELQAFDRFLDSHPAIDRDVQNKPSLLEDRAYVAAHPELRDFLATHPRVREDVRQNPTRLVNRERAFERSGQDIRQPEVRNFDEFLDRHPAIDRELARNPSLANDPNYLVKHPDLNNYLASHPQIRSDIRQNPRAFMRQERKLDQKERKVERREERREERFTRDIKHFR